MTLYRLLLLVTIVIVQKFEAIDFKKYVENDLFSRCADVDVLTNIKE